MLQSLFRQKNPSEEVVWTPELLKSPHEAHDKAGRVRRMFNAIAPTYELVNHVVTGGLDVSWRRRVVGLVQTTGEDEVLDVACGTGDLARAFVRSKPKRVVGCDFAECMLAEARKKDCGDVTWCQGDALRLPFADESFSIVSCGFGVRNLQDVRCALIEFRRVLRCGGRVVVLESTRPRGRIARLGFDVYVNRLMPWIATRISGDRTGAYRYFPRSVEKFFDAQEFSAELGSAGFSRCHVKHLMFGIATIHLAWKDGIVP